MGMKPRISASVEIAVVERGLKARPIVRGVAKLARGLVWCHRCGRMDAVDAGECLRFGWPPCCGETMSIDSPEERAEMAKGSAGETGE